MLRRSVHSRPPALTLVLGAAFSIVAGLREAPPAHAQATGDEIDLWAWGRNRSGELGVVALNETLPTPVGVTGEWVELAAGTDHVLALDASGGVWAWGRNDHGQLGDGTHLPSLRPKPVPGLVGVTHIEAGGTHSLALRNSDDTLWVWGSNAFGQLGLPAAGASLATPTVLDGLTAVVDVAAGTLHTLAVTADGALWSWGANFYGQLGHGNLTPLAVPTRVESLSGVTAVGAGASHSLAIAGAAGQVWTWGWNVFGQLGTGQQGTPDDGVLSPVKAVGVTGAVRVTGGDFHSLAVTQNGRLWAWGYNTEGQVGNGDLTPANTGILTPVLLDAPTGVAAVDAGGIHTVALTSTGEVWTWGSNQFGSCGNGGRRDVRLPVRPPGVVGAVAVAASAQSTIMAARAPSPSAVHVQGGGLDTDAAPRIQLAISEPLLAYDAGARHVVALDGERRVWVWGENDRGQLGRDGGAAQEPELLQLPPGPAPDIAQVAAGDAFTLALRSDGVVLAWGDNTAGQLGIDSVDSRVSEPTIIAELSAIVMVAAGGAHALALDAEGVTWGWGNNREGQLGRTTPDTLRAPESVPALFGATAIAAGGSHSLAIGPTGTLLSWGASRQAQLGRNRIRADHLPRPVELPISVAMVAAGGWHSLALGADGSVWAFGDDRDCQLGQGARTDFWTPLRVPLGVPARYVAAGQFHSLAVTVSGGLFGWGNDGYGQLGADPIGTRQCRPIELEPAGIRAASGGRQLTLFN